MFFRTRRFESHQHRDDRVLNLLRGLRRASRGGAFWIDTGILNLPKPSLNSVHLWAARGCAVRRKARCCCALGGDTVPATMLRRCILEMSVVLDNQSCGPRRRDPDTITCDAGPRRFVSSRTPRTLVGVAVSGLLACSNIVVGVLAQSTSVVATGFEFAGDVLASSIVLVGMGVAARPADENHPYGHGRFETLSAFVVGVILAAAA